MSRFFWPSSLFEPLATVVVCGVAVYFVINLVLHEQVPLRRREAEEFAIPGLLWQTWYTHQLPPLARSNIEELKRLNPEYSHHLVNDSEAALFMAEHFSGRVFDAYLAINPVLGAARADLWRYCVLFVYGGFYVDLDVGCNAPLRAMHGPRDHLVITHENTRLPTKLPRQLRCLMRETEVLEPSRVARSGFKAQPIAQLFLGATPRHPLIKAAIDAVVEAIETLDESKCLDSHGRPPALSRRDQEKGHSWTWLRTIWLTGPFALTLAFHNATLAQNIRTLDFKRGPSVCSTSRQINAKMSAAKPKYTSIADNVPFLVDHTSSSSIIRR